MKIITQEAKGRLLVALINGITGGASVLVAIVLYRNFGFNLIVSMIVLMIIGSLSLMPLRKIIMVKYYRKI